MRITDWKEGVWYKSSCVGDEHRRMGAVMQRRDRYGLVVCDNAALTGPGIFATDWREVVTDPLEAAWKEYRAMKGGEITNSVVSKHESFVAGWSARGDSLKIDVEAAYRSWISRDPAIGVETLLNEINAGEFRVKQ